MRRKFEVEFAVGNVKAFQIAERLFDQFYNRKGVFADYSMPEYVLPRNLKEGTREHALYLTYVISIDKLTKAKKLWRKSRGSYELYPERFTPKEILKLSPRTIGTFTKGLGARFYSSAAKTWIKISDILVDKYGGDPRNLTSQPLTIEELKEKIDEFPQLRGPKLINFYIRAMGETGLFKVKNLNELDIAVDKQVARFTMYTGVLKLLSEQFTGCVHEDPMRSLIEETWRNAVKKLGTPPWKLDEPIWTIGSELCSQRKCGRCPVEDLCDKTKGITFKENTAIWRRQN